jgi:hypothetical protein
MQNDTNRTKARTHSMHRWIGFSRKKLIAPAVAAALALAVLPSSAGANTLNISVEPVAHLNGCVYRTEFQRGDQGVFLITVADPATGEPVTQGIDVNVLVGDNSLKANYNATQKLWAAPLPILWDMPTGTLRWSVSATDARGNVTKWQPSYAANQTITIAPGPLKVNTSVTDPVSGEAVGEIRPGETVRIMSKIDRPTHGDSYSYGSAEREITGSIPEKGAPVKSDATVKALIGQGAFGPAKAAFSGPALAELPLSFDAAREAWTATFTMPQDAPHGTYSVAVLAEDKHGNKGQAMLGAMPLVIPVVEPGLLEGTRGLMAGGGLALFGLAIGSLMAFRRSGSTGRSGMAPTNTSPAASEA